MGFQVAIDGPAGAGKSSVARGVAQVLQISYVDTGAMYRSVTYLALLQGVQASNTCQLEKLLHQIVTKIDFQVVQGEQHLFLGDMDLSDSIRSQEVTRNVSTIAANSLVRKYLVQKQRDLALSWPGVVMDGRDIGTHVLLHANVKFFLTASLEQRAKRRYDELVKKGFHPSLTELMGDIERRDQMDIERDLSPLRPAQDAIILDTSCLTQHEVIEMVVALCRLRMTQGEA